MTATKAISESRMLDLQLNTNDAKISWNMNDI
jgi:hypothetical protein